MLGVLIKDEFRVVRLIGEGGMGRVYEGEQQMGSRPRKVAIKLLHHDLSMEDQFRTRFQRECETVVGLQHHNTIKFFAFGEAPFGQLFIAMEYLNGKSVGGILKESGPMAPVRVDKIMQQVCSSLAEAHQKGIVHRDLKPDNIFLTDHGGDASDYVKVLDFGIAKQSEATSAKHAQQLTKQGMLLGTPAYMSPEQFLGTHLDHRSDIYSLGVMAYEMLMGVLPFSAVYAWDWIDLHMNAKPAGFDRTDVPHGAAIPQAMKSAVMRALAKNPDERPLDVATFYREFSAASRPQPHSQPEPASAEHFSAAATVFARPSLGPPTASVQVPSQPAVSMVDPLGTVIAHPMQIPTAQIQVPSRPPAGYAPSPLEKTSEYLNAGDAVGTGTERMSAKEIAALSVHPPAVNTAGHHPQTPIPPGYLMGAGGFTPPPGGNHKSSGSVSTFFWGVACTAIIGALVFFVVYMATFGKDCGEQDVDPANEAPIVWPSATKPNNAAQWPPPVPTDEP